MASSLDNPVWVEWMTTLMGGVSRQTYAATLPPDRYYCLLDELPLHLIPRRVLKSLESSKNRDQVLFLNPRCIFGRAEDVPGHIGPKDLLAGFALQGAIAWTPGVATGALLPFWLGPQLQDVVRELRCDEPIPSSVPDHTRSLLLAANVVRLESGTVPLGAREDAVGKATRLFREKGYAPVSGLIHPFHVAALRRYYRYLIRSGAIRLGDGQSPRRYVAYNEPVARFFHHHLLAPLSTVAGQPLKPSYVYFASYLSGAELKKHTDREQCEFSVTLCLDFSPEPELETPWPIHLDTPTGKVTVYQALGDGLAYRGTRLPHYRDVLGAGQTSTSIFFHYVSADFSGSLA
jgi:hypothetical protein